MKNHNQMNGEYPDLHIEYQDNISGEKGYVNIEVDVGYSEKVIGRKLKIPNLHWYANSNRQRDKVLKIAKYMPVKVIGEKYWQ